MLKTLYIENIAVIEKASIEFGSGLNVLTGETGAGKSIIIDAINAVMGRRTSKDIVRTGADSAFVSAEFTDVSSDVETKLAGMGLGCDEGTLVLQRNLSKSGKSSCKINGRPASLSMLRELSPELINIHGQHESYELFSSDRHIDYIDRFGCCEELLEEYNKHYCEYKELKKKFNEASADESERLREIDLLSYQISELTDAAVAQGEEQSLENERRALMNYEKVLSLLCKAKMLLDGDDNTRGGVDFIDGAMGAIQSACEYNDDYSELADRLADAYYGLRDCKDSISDAVESLDSDPKRLEEIEERLDLINRLKRKYNCQSDELSAFAERCAAKLDELVNYDKNRGELEEKCAASEKSMLDSAEKLSKQRKKSAEKFARHVKNEMAFLNMPGVELVPRFERCAPYRKGTDRVELLISANPGEEPRPVAKIASGGELSRMMLAIKTVLSEIDSVQTLIFDEVDAGVSGCAAEKVGLKLLEVSRNRQVLCVTHQAQIAAIANLHCLIRKSVSGGRTYTNVLPLDHKGRVEELARIIGGVEITEAALNHAESMLEKYGN